MFLHLQSTAAKAAAHAVQTYRMGNKQEMVVAVRAPEGKQGPINVTLTTDVPQDLFLHWGIRKQGGGDWVAPPKVPPTTAPKHRR